MSALINLGYGHAQAGAAVSAAMRKSGDEATAEEQVENIEAILRDGTLLTGQPYTDMLTLDEVVADGALTVTTVRLTGDAHGMTPVNMVMRSESLFSVS